MADNDKSRKIVNASGFLFQLSIEHTIRNAYKDHPVGENTCIVVAREYPWLTEDGEGYIDIIVTKGHSAFVIECKRTRGGTWVFPVEEHMSENLTRISCLQLLRNSDGDLAGGVRDTSAGPESMEAQFCCVRGASEGQQSMLERICGPLLVATESFAVEGMKLEGSGTMWFIPAIVTNAQLLACVVDPLRIDDEGNVPDDAEFKEVPWIRFRKALVTGLMNDASTASRLL